MNRNTILAVLGAIAILLVGTIGTELLAYRGDDGNVAPAKPQPATQTAKAGAKNQPPDDADEDKDSKDDSDESDEKDDKADVAGSASTESLSADVLARPLFAPGRHPPSLPAAATDSRDSTMPRLTGIVVLTGLKLAIFQGTDKPLVVREGDRVAGRKIQTIGPLEVVLQGPRGEERLRTMPDSTLVRERPPQPVPVVARPGQPFPPYGNRPRNAQEADGRGFTGRAQSPGRGQPNSNQAPHPGQPGRAFFPPGPNRNRP